MENSGSEKKEKDQKWHHRTDQVQYLKREIHFTVESPTGESIPMRYKPDMTFGLLHQIACKKFGLNPDDHYIVFNCKEMDNMELLKNVMITQTSVLKIYKGRKVTMVPDIFVSVRVRDCRIGSVFKMTDNLWDILHKLLSEKSYKPDLVPIVIYKKNEFIGESALTRVRLRDMGVTQGSCVVRFIQLRQEDLDDRKVKEDDDTLATLESLEMKNIGSTADTGGKTVHFKLDEDELDSENIQFIGERRTLAFRLPDPSSMEERVQEEYFDLLLEEIQGLFMELSKRKGVAREELHEAVRTELEKLAEIRTDFDDTLVRVVFPDRVCLQGVFLPEEKVSDVKEHIKKYLKYPDADFDFYVLRDNEKTSVQDYTTLVELKLIPAIRLFFNVENEYMSGDQFLSDEVLLNLTSYNVGKEAALMLRGESVDRILMAEDGGTSFRKSTGSFLNKFIRSSHSSNKPANSGARGFEGSRAYSRAFGLGRKTSTFNPRSRSKGSTNLSRHSSSEEEDHVGRSNERAGRELIRESSLLGSGLPPLDKIPKKSFDNEQ